MAGGLFEVELEGMPAEAAEFEVARRFVNLAASSARHAALAQPHPGVNPQTVARAAVAAAARTYAPGVYRTMMRSLGGPGMRRFAMIGRNGSAGMPSRYPAARQQYGRPGPQRALVSGSRGPAAGQRAAAPGSRALATRGAASASRGAPSGYGGYRRRPGGYGGGGRRRGYG